MERKNEVLSTKLKNNEHDQSKLVQEKVNQKQGNQVLFARFEEINAALERAFDRISALETENNRLMESISTEKTEKIRIQKELEKL